MVRPSIQKIGWCTFLVLGVLFFVLTVSHVEPFFFGETLLADVGLSVGVAPNPYNTLDEQLAQKEAYLDEEQSYMNSEQAALASSSALAISPTGTPYLLYLALAVVLLAVLVFLNFYLDWRRAKTPPQGQDGQVVK